MLVDQAIRALGEKESEVGDRNTTITTKILPQLMQEEGGSNPKL